LFHVERQERLEVADAKVAAEQLPHLVDVVLLRLHDAIAVPVEGIVRQFVPDETIDRGFQRLIVVTAENLEECAVELRSCRRVFEQRDEHAPPRVEGKANACAFLMKRSSSTVRSERRYPDPKRTAGSSSPIDS
jgi:hypothetical protein